MDHSRIHFGNRLGIHVDCIFGNPTGQEVSTTLLQRLYTLLDGARHTLYGVEHRHVQSQYCFWQIHFHEPLRIPKFLLGVLCLRKFLVECDHCLAIAQNASLWKKSQALPRPKPDAGHASFSGSHGMVRLCGILDHVECGLVAHFQWSLRWSILFAHGDR